jgi:integrase
LAGAKEAARIHRTIALAGADPVAKRHAAVSAAAAERAAQRTFAWCCEQYLAAHEAGWKSAKHCQQWRNTLAAYAEPVMGRLLVRDVTTTHVLQVIEKEWATKNETMNRVRNRIELVLDWAAARGYREGPNPARWRGHLDKTLPKPTKVKKTEHHAALPYHEVGAFMVKLRAANGMGARALEFAILTAARSGEVRGMTWGEVNLEAKLWVIAGSRMKGRREHRVPLSSAAAKLLQSLPRREDVDLVFPGPSGKALSDMTMTKVLRDMQVPATAHGFRSSFRDWVSERTGYPSEVAEMALAHAVGDKVEAAYRRGDLYEKRVRVMADWAAYIARPETKAGKVVPLHRSA